MEKRYQHTTNGQSVLQADLNTLGEASALADDRVFAELFRMAPYDGTTVRRGVLPYGVGAATVAPHGATGSVLVNPFRAFIGSRTAVATDAKQNWRDTRSAIGVGSTTLEQSVAIAANSSGNPRWDLVCAAVAVDAPSAGVTRKVKDPTSKVITGTVLVTTLETTVSLDVVAGTPGATPAFPALPTDSGGTYYIPLAFVRVPNGFGASSTVLKKDINEVAPILSVSAVTGASSLRPANTHNAVNGTALSGAGASTQSTSEGFGWTGTAGARPGLYIPPSMQGVESLILVLDIADASSANWSHQNGAVLDDSRDWRNRISRWSASAGFDTTGPATTPWGPHTAGHGCIFTGAEDAGGTGSLTSSPMPGYAPSASTLVAQAHGLGSTFGNTHNTGNSEFAAAIYASGASSAATPANGANMPTAVMAASSFVGVYVDQSTGKLKLAVSGTPRCAVSFWIDFTAPYPNL